MKAIHRTSALILLVFIVAHLFNHSLIFVGVEEHIEFMDLIRSLYRNSIVELILVVCAVIQVVTGSIFVWRGGGQARGVISRLQIWSGLYLAIFLINHIAAVAVGRYLLDLDTNIFFAVAGFYVTPFQYFFVPYYFLAVASIFTHLAAALFWITSSILRQRQREWLFGLIFVSGLFFSLVLMVGFLGGFGQLDIPAEYLNVYRSVFSS